MSPLSLTLLIAVSFVGSFVGRRWGPTACRCGREKPPWFYRLHVRVWVSALTVVVGAVVAVTGALSADGVLWQSVLIALACVATVKSIIEHEKGRRSVLGRLLGRVVVTEHGRLKVQPE